MKPLSGIFVATACCLLMLLKVGAADDPIPRRNVSVRKIVENATSLSLVPRIHGGAFAEEGQFKYMVFLLSYESEIRPPLSTCSASLIHPSWVLTAAHCVSQRMIAVAGRADLSGYWHRGRRLIPFNEDIDEKMFGVQERRVSRAFVHPGYSTVTYEKDLALLVVNRPFHVANDRVAPVSVLPLASSKMTFKMKCIVVGWGLDERDVQTFKLMFASEVDAKTPELGCHYLQKGPFICLEPGGPGICRGDSGSPLVCHQEAWGIASFAIDKIDDADSASAEEEYYSQIYPELAWIRDTMKNGATPAAAPLTCVAVAFAIINIFDSKSLGQF